MGKIKKKGLILSFRKVKDMLSAASVTANFHYSRLCLILSGHWDYKQDAAPTPAPISEPIGPKPKNQHAEVSWPTPRGHEAEAK